MNLVTTTTAFNPNALLRHAAGQAVSFDFTHLGWPVGVALVSLVIMVILSRRQNARYRRRPTRR